MIDESWKIQNIMTKLPLIILSMSVDRYAKFDVNTSTHTSSNAYLRCCLPVMWATDYHYLSKAVMRSNNLANNMKLVDPKNDTSWAIESDSKGVIKWIWHAKKRNLTKNPVLFLCGRYSLWHVKNLKLQFKTPNLKLQF